MSAADGDARLHLPVLTEGPLGFDELAGLDARAPKTREDCLEGGSNAARPCPWVRCAEHLVWVATIYRSQPVEGDPSGRALAPRERLLEQATNALSGEAPSCVLDLVDAHPEGLTLDAIGELLGLTRERVRQIEAKALATAGARARRAQAFTDEDLLELGRCEADELPTQRGTGHTRALPVEDQRTVIPAPAAHRHLPLFDAVAAGETFWCQRMGSPVSTRLCSARRTSTTEVNKWSSRPTYPICADCSDGAALAERLGEAARSAPLPAPPIASARAIRFFGEDDDSETPTDPPKETIVHDSSPTPAPAQLDPAVTLEQPKRCRAYRCKHSPAGLRADSPGWVFGLCSAHRQAVRACMRDFECAPERVAELLVTTENYREVLREERDAAGAPPPPRRAKAPQAPEKVTPPFVVAAPAPARVTTSAAPTVVTESPAPVAVEASVVLPAISVAATSELGRLVLLASKYGGAEQLEQIVAREAELSERVRQLGGLAALDALAQALKAIRGPA